MDLTTGSIAAVVPLDMNRKHSAFISQNLLIGRWPPRSSSDKSLRRKKTMKKTTTAALKMTMMTEKKTTDTPPAFVSGEG
jgi:hypothetical protein